MTENRELVPSNQEVEIKLLSGKDNKDWEVVQRVLSHLRKDGCTTTLAACEDAGVARSVYYAALANPVVQELRAQQMVGVSVAAQYLIERGWLPLIGNMLTIAMNDDSREAVQAARLVKDIYKDVQEGLGPGGGRPGEETAAAKAMRQFLGGKKVKRLIQTTTVQEIEVSDGNEDVVEGVATVITEK